MTDIENTKHNDIAIFTSRRSGGTWLSEMIGHNDGVRHIGQPLSAKQILQSTLDISIPILAREQIIDINDDEKKALRRHIKKVLTGDQIINAPYRFWRQEFDWVAERLALKITDSNSIIKWFAKEFDISVIYLTRHPIPQSLSVIKKGYYLTATAYLNNEWFTSNYMNDRQIKRSWEILNGGNSLKKHVLGWALENMVPLRESLEDQQWLWINYEGAVYKPEETVNQLSEYLNVEDKSSMMDAVDTPSKTADSYVSSQIKENTSRKSFLVKRWLNKVSQENVMEAVDVLELLGIEVYDETPFPNKVAQ